MREYVDKIKKIFASQNFIRYREANDSLIIDSFYTDPVANDHTIGVMIYKTEDGKLRIDDMKMIDEILDVNDIDLSNHLHKEIVEMLLNAFSLKVEDKHCYRELYDIDTDYENIMKNKNAHSYVIENILTFFSGIVAFGKISEIVNLCTKNE
ncbi:unknown [Coprobacillus sp. CAG:698]|nr:unknown [Coprobacillus sp. CAG:698]